MAAIIPTTVHPLSKSPCGFCGAPIREKDREAHLEVMHADEGDRGAEDNEISRKLEPMFGEEETAPQSEREAYHNAI
jgi:hypothetical protein